MHIIFLVLKMICLPFSVLPSIQHILVLVCFFFNIWPFICFYIFGFSLVENCFHLLLSLQFLLPSCWQKNCNSWSYLPQSTSRFYISQLTLAPWKWGSRLIRNFRHFSAKLWGVISGMTVISAFQWVCWISSVCNWDCFGESKNIGRSDSSYQTLTDDIFVKL